MRKMIAITCLIMGILTPSLLIAVERAPRISDREIVERLSRLEQGQKNLERRIDSLDKGLNNRIDDLRSEMNSRFDAIQWMFGLFITITLVILGFVLRMQWQMHRRQTRIETTLEVHKDDLAFLKGLIEKLLPPRKH
jgi:hypothetical protein